MPPQQSSFTLEQLLEEKRRRESLAAPRGGPPQLAGQVSATPAEKFLQSEPARLAGALGKSFLRNQPVQNPARVVREVREAGAGNVLQGLAQGQQQTLMSGLGALKDIALGPASFAASLASGGSLQEAVGEGPFSALTRATNIPLAAVPLIGAQVSQEAVEPGAEAVSLEPREDRPELMGQALGGALGLGLSGVVDRGLSVGTGNALKRLRGTKVASAAGETLTAGQRPGATGLTRFTEAMVSRFPGGRATFEKARNAAQVNLVNNGINRVLGTMANFKGTRLELLNRVGRATDDIIEQLRQRNRGLYQEFDAALEATNQRLPVRGPPTRGQAARGLGGDEVTALVKAPGQAGAGVAGAAPAGVRVTSFAGDAVADIADRLVASVGAERLLVRAPELESLVSKVENLRSLRGRAVPITIATDARSTLLSLARKMDNPLGSKEASVVSQIFDPIDKGIETTLREVGGVALAEKWRRANSRVKQLHNLVTDTLFEQVTKSGSPELIAAAFDNATAVDLSQMRARLPVDQWDNVRTLLVRDKIAKKAVRGESPSVARGGAAGAGEPLRVDVAGVEAPTVKPGAINEALNDMDEATRGILLSDKEISSWRRLNESVGRVGNVGEEIGKLVGSGIAAGTMLGFAGAGLELFGGTPGAAAGAIAALPTMVIGSRVAAAILTRPALMDRVATGFMGAGRVAADATILGNMIVNELPDEALVEFISDNNLSPDQLSAEVRQRLGIGGPPNLLEKIQRGPIQLTSGGPPGLQPPQQ